MKSEKLMDAIGMVGDDLIAEAKTPRKRTIRWQRIAAAAACLALIIACFLLWFPGKESPQISGSIPTITTTAPAIPTVPTTVPPNNNAISITQRVEAEAPGYGFVGNYEAIRNVESPGMYLANGIAVTAKAAEILPDTYYFYNDPLQSRWHLVKMVTLNTLHGNNIPEEFYFLLPEAYFTDLTEYDSLIIKDLAQYGYENTVLYNASRGTAEICDYVLFGAYMFSPTPSLSHLFIAACSDGEFDESLWSVTAEWEKYTQYFRARLDAPDDYTMAGRGWTQEQVETAVIRQCNEDNPWGEETVDLLSSLQTDAAQTAIAYVTSFKNGIFAPQITGSTLSIRPEVAMTYRRYLNGYPTNETVRLHGEKVYTSDAKFTESDAQTLPDLASALYAVNQAFEKGEITPPHILDWKNRELLEYAIFGWYAKTSTGVYGIIRIDWRYKGDHFYGSLDDKYYIIEAGVDEVQSISQDDLLKILDQGNDFVYTSEYDENGKKDIYGSVPPPV